MRTLLAAAALSLLALGCSSSTSDPPLTTPTFGTNEQKIWAVPSRLEIDSPMVIVTRCLPLVDGKGRIMFHSQTGLRGIQWHILEPVDTVMAQPHSRDTLNDIDLPVAYHANVPLEIHWRIQLSMLESHGFSANFSMDSVYLPDGPGMVGLHSPEAIKHSGKIDGYDGMGYAYPPLTLSR